jgi:hypothetical protein
MTSRDWFALVGCGSLALMLVLITVVVRRKELKGRRSSERLFTHAETALWSVSVGAVFVGGGAFVAQQVDLKTFLVGLGASALGAGLVASMSL